MIWVYIQLQAELVTILNDDVLRRVLLRSTDEVASDALFQILLKHSFRETGENLKSERSIAETQTFALLQYRLEILNNNY